MNHCIILHYFALLDAEYHFGEFLNASIFKKMGIRNIYKHAERKSTQNILNNALLISWSTEDEQNV